MDDPGLHYRVFLLRCWQEQREDPTEPAPWRVSLDAAPADERRGFTSLEGLVAFLHRELRPAPSPVDDDRRRGSLS